ncbi:hypothetical protein GCM10007989_04990 [Devosia pacifica]|uniref:Uncharacterized protein n=1 Tax=Devosia pacifica TaxID=1335967 RepID=A0A918RUN2_9HYPH|nr:hypothetical protein [Devosia pacifica]GHA13391.1 hypothetical protein GCM10007989_04990 [Devosia pacifica]
MPIAGNMAEARQKVVASVDRFRAEPVKIYFFHDGVTDPGRQPVEIKAVLAVGGGDESNIAGGFAQSWRTQLAAGKAELHIDRATYDGPPLKTGDKVEAISRHGKPLWGILRVDDRGDTRLVAELGEA